MYSSVKHQRQKEFNLPVKFVLHDVSDKLPCMQGL